MGVVVEGEGGGDEGGVGKELGGGGVGVGVEGLVVWLLP